jgi:uncharacterized membrane protein
MKKFTLIDGVALVIWLLPTFYLFSMYQGLPQTVPVHYGLNGTVDRYGSKGEFLVTSLILIGVSAFVYLLLKFLPAIDPKKKVKYGESTFQKMAFGIIIFLAALNISIMYATAHRGFDVGKLIFPLAGLLFVFIGNIMNSIKPNYFAGFKTPWALENEDNWRATHRLASRLWVGGGLVITIGTFVLPAELGTIVFMCGVAVLTLIPFGYSYQYFRKHRLNQNS